MKITQVKIHLVREDKLKAYASIVFDDCFIVNDLKVIKGKNGYFISMPSKKRKNGTYKDIAHPLNTETRRWIEETILREYGKISGEEVERTARTKESGEVKKGESKSKDSLDAVEEKLNDSFWSV